MAMKINWYPISAIAMCIILWILIVVCGIFIWKHYTKSAVVKTIQVLEIERSFYVK